MAFPCTSVRKEIKLTPNLQLSKIKAVPTKWKWYYKSGTDIRADVSYDMWIGTNPSGGPASSDTKYEIMIWLSTKGR